MGKLGTCTCVAAAGFVRLGLHDMSSEDVFDTAPKPPEPPVAGSPPALSGLARWTAGRLVRLLALGTGIYFCFLVLELISVVGYRPIRIHLDPVAVNENGYAIVKGSARPGAQIEVLAGEQKSLSFSRADWRGLFTVEVQPPPEAQTLWARAVSLEAPDFELYRSEPVPIARRPGRPSPPEILLAYFIEDLQILWVSGRGVPNGNFPLRSESGKWIDHAFVQAGGYFDALIPIAKDEPPPTAILPGTGKEKIEAPQPGDPKPFPVTHVSAEALPLSRNADIDLRGENTHVRIRIGLPPVHPCFMLLEKGLIGVEEFVKSTFGETNYSGTVTLVSVHKLPYWAVVEAEQTWRGTPSTLSWYGSNAIGMVPLLTSRDSIKVRFHGLKPAWFGEPSPSSIDNESAIWQGPERARHVQALGFGAMDLLRMDNAASPNQHTGKKGGDEEERFRDFVGKLGGEGAATLRSSWQQILLLIPFGWVIWLGLRKPFGTGESWRTLTATAVILALWRTFTTLGPSIRRVGDLLSANPLLYDAAGYGQRAEINEFAFWMSFGLIAATLPAVWQHLVSREILPTQALAPSRTFARRALSGLRWGYFATLLLLFLAMMADYVKPAEFLTGEIRELKPPPHLVLGVALTLCVCLILLTFGFRALLMGAGLATILLWQLLQSELERNRLDLSKFRAVTDIAQFPRLLVFALSTLAVLPFLSLLLKRLTGSYLARRYRWLLTATFATAALVTPHLPGRAVLTASGSLLLFGFGGIILCHVLNAGSRKPWRTQIKDHPRITRGGLFLLALLLAWPLTSTRQGLEYWQLRNLNFQIQDLFVYVVAFGLVFLLREYSLHASSPVPEPATREVGVYLFAVLLINSYSLWLLLPVPFLVALVLASLWLLRPDEDMERLHRIAGHSFRRLRHLIQDIVDASTAGEQFSAIQRALLAKLKNAELTPTEYEGKLELYRGYLEEKLELETVTRNVQSREAVFGVGGPTLWDNVSAAVKVGALLAAGPLLIALYQFLPRSRVGYAYPVVTLLDFVLSALASWLLCAFFFGFYFSYLRGQSGLSKGIYLFVGICLPFAVYRVLNAQSIADMRFFLLWATQLFLFTSLLGLIAFDYRLLRSNRFQIRDLTAVHNMPSLSAYASTAIAALVPTVIALITGKFGELVKFFLETVIGLPTTGGK